MTAPISEAQSRSAFERRGLACGEQADEPTHCWACEWAFAVDELVDIDGVPLCGSCAAIETGDDGRPDRVRDL